jgi:hypothetical protein
VPQVISTARARSSGQPAIGLSHFYADQGRPGNAWQALAPVYGWFAEGFDTPNNIKDARELLEALDA